METEAIVKATNDALVCLSEARFFCTERGFHGRFYCVLQNILEERGLLKSPRVLEMEYQKSSRHEISQRPDIILHVPAEDSDAQVSEFNFAVWALKRRATKSKAREDFEKLNEMFYRLEYPLGIFVNIDAQDHMASEYLGCYKDRLYAVAVWLEDQQAMVDWNREL